MYWDIIFQKDGFWNTLLTQHLFRASFRQYTALGRKIASNLPIYLLIDRK